MKIFVKDMNREAEIYLYGIDGKDHTEDFAERHFLGNGLEFLSAEEKEKTNCKYAISRRNYEYLIERLNAIQKAIDDAAEDIEENGCSAEAKYGFGRGKYVI